MNIKELEKVKVSLSKVVRKLFLSKIIVNNDIGSELDENLETLFSGYESLLKIIDIYKGLK
jgi:hypothetical protein